MTGSARRVRGLTIEDAAIELGVHRNTVYRLIRQGYLEASKVQGRWTISRRSLRNVTESNYPWRDTLQRLRRHLNEIHDLIAVATVAVGITPVDGRFIAASEHYAMLLGCDQSWFHHHTYLDYTPPEERSNAASLVARAIHEPGRCFEYSRRILSGGGLEVLVDFEVAAAPLDAAKDSMLVVCRGY